LAQAYVAIENNACTPMPFGIFKAEVMVGFIMMAYVREDQDEALDENIYEYYPEFILRKVEDEVILIKFL
jgi:hypothetical protein